MRVQPTIVRSIVNKKNIKLNSLGGEGTLGPHPVLLLVEMFSVIKVS